MPLLASIFDLLVILGMENKTTKENGPPVVDWSAKTLMINL